MPNTSSAKKALRQTAKRRAHNRTQRSALRSVLKSTRTTIEAGDAASGEKALSLAFKKLDQAAAKGLIHKNAASRSKSRLAHLAKKQAAK
ncbi:MAG: 30S ribosomal protein S20 [Planctomycetaceae bacterium]|nr:30S ribosomal protein S20 [Planctomycetaceae bacterium]